MLSSGGAARVPAAIHDRADQSLPGVLLQETELEYPPRYAPLASSKVSKTAGMPGAGGPGVALGFRGTDHGFEVSPRLGGDRCVASYTVV